MRAHLVSSRRRLLLEPLENRVCPSTFFSVIGATGSPTDILEVKVFDQNNEVVHRATPFNNLTSLRVATGDFDGDGIVDEVAVLGRRTNTDLRAEIVTYDLNTNSGALTETARFNAFGPGIFGNGFIASGDFDGDGDDDIVVSQIGGGRDIVALQTHLSTAGVFSKGASRDVDFGFVSAPRIGAGDTDGDGFAEIVIAARTPSGADVRVFDADGPTLDQQGQFFWTFGVTGYNRGAFVAVGEFDPTGRGEEIVLGSNITGSGRVDVVKFDDPGAGPLLAENGRFEPFGTEYNAAVRVAVGQTADTQSQRSFILAGQDRFTDGLAVVAFRNFDLNQMQQAPNPAFTMATAFTALEDSDGEGPRSNIPLPSNGFRFEDLTLGPFVAVANPLLVHAKGGVEALQPANLNNATGSGRVIQAGAEVAFAIAGDRLALPSGAVFVSPSNNLFLNVSLLSGVAGALNQLDLDLVFYSNTGAVIDNIALINQTQINNNTLQLSVQLADNAPTTIQAGVPTGGVLFGGFNGGVMANNPNNVFDGVFPEIMMGAGFWVLELNNRATTDLTLLEWELFWDFA